VLQVDNGSEETGTVGSKTSVAGRSIIRDHLRPPSLVEHDID
jgi:hypothetical protein